jgi:hypothetical protein
MTRSFCFCYIRCIYGMYVCTYVPCTSICLWGLSQHIAFLSHLLRRAAARSDPGCLPEPCEGLAEGKFDGLCSQLERELAERDDRMGRGCTANRGVTVGGAVSDEMKGRAIWGDERVATRLLCYTSQLFPGDPVLVRVIIPLFVQTFLRFDTVCVDDPLHRIHASLCIQMIESRFRVVNPRAYITVNAMLAGLISLECLVRQSDCYRLAATSQVEEDVHRKGEVDYKSGKASKRRLSMGIYLSHSR